MGGKLMLDTVLDTRGCCDVILQVEDVIKQTSPSSGHFMFKVKVPEWLGSVE